jgi:hypothetical protein
MYPSLEPINSTTQDKNSAHRYFPSISSMRLELLLSQILDLNSGISKPFNKGGQYGIECSDFVSLSFAVIHSVRSATVVEFQQNNRNDHSTGYNGKQKHGNHEKYGISNYCSLRVVGEVPDSIVSTVQANARCVVLAPVASAMQWYLIRLLSYPISLPSPSSSNSPLSRSLSSCRYII